MTSKTGLDRRDFLKAAGVSAAATIIPGQGTAAIADANGKFDFDENVNRIGSDCVKWDRTISEYPGSDIKVAMGIADMDYRIAPAISAAIQERVNHDVWGYGSVSRSYKEAIVDWNKRHHDEEIHTDMILACAGVHEGIVSSLRAFAPDGGKVILLTPAYSTFYSDIKRGGCVPLECPLALEDGRYALDFETLERTFDDETRALIICNPNNPTGNCWTADEMTTLGELCTRRGVVVLSDEVHGDIIREDSHYTPYSTLDNEELVLNSVTLKSNSKAFNLAGHKVSYFFSRNSDYVKKIEATGHYGWLNSLGFVACRAAMREGDEWLAQVVDYINANMDFVDEYVRVNMPLVGFSKPQGTYLAWLDFGAFFERIDAQKLTADFNSQLDASAKPYSAEQFMQRYFVYNAGIHINDGFRYGPGSAGYMRMNIATSRNRVQIALDKLSEVTNNA
jgi:cystathionine beta-lyase